MKTPKTIAKNHDIVGLMNLKTIQLINDIELYGKEMSIQYAIFRDLYIGNNLITMNKEQIIFKKFIKKQKRKQKNENS